MKNLTLLLVLTSLLFSCSTDSDESLSSFEGSSRNGNGNGNGQAGVITAAEWNDLDHWNFWTSLLNDSSLYQGMPEYWGIYTQNRFAFEVKHNMAPAVDIPVELYYQNHLVWTSRTNNEGLAELWLLPFIAQATYTTNDLKVHINGALCPNAVKNYNEGVNTAQLTSVPTPTDLVQIAFMVDATGSMGDEIAFLKQDLKNVINQLNGLNPHVDIETAAVFYRDETDSYLVRQSAFSSVLSHTTNFIDQQSASGGGDYPEAVHAGLKESIQNLQWSAQARSRILFILLDAPPHYTQSVISQMQTELKSAAQKGICIIPIAASGIDKNTEFLLRFMAILTNGSYVFITDDSGVGNSHIRASVGTYQIEKLNELMLRILGERCL